MKKTLIVLSLLMLSTAAFAQYSASGGAGYGYLSSQPQIYHAPEHPQHAGFQAMTAETTLYPGTSYTIAQGDRPPSDFPQAASASLGDIARELRKQHELVKKSKIVWVNQ